MEKELYVFQKSKLYKLTGFKDKLLEKQPLDIPKAKFIMVI